MLSGIPTVEVTVGHYLREWQKQEIRDRILERIELEKMKVLHEERLSNTDIVIVAGERTRDL